MIPAQPVATSVAIGPDGAYYVGELKGFPAPTGESRVWRIEPGSRNVRCGESKKCTVVLDGFTSIIDLAFGPDGRLNVAQIDDASWLAMELGAGVGGSVRACNLQTKACSTVVSANPALTFMLTSIVYRGSALWGAHDAARSRRRGRRSAAASPVAVRSPRVRPTGLTLAGYAPPGAAEGHAHRARLRRAVARPRALARRAADDLGAHGARLVRATDVGHPADHRSRLVLHDVLEDARRPRCLRVPEPLRPHVRRRLHRDVDGDQGAAALGSRHARRRVVDRALGPGLLSAEAAERRHGGVLPHALARLEVHVSRQRSRTRSRRSSASTSSTRRTSARTTRSTSCGRCTR